MTIEIWRNGELQRLEKVNMFELNECYFLIMYENGVREQYARCTISTITVLL